MKPVIKKQTHYNLLLMRDDSAAHTFRVHSTLLRIFLLVLFLLMAGGAGGIAGGMHYWKKYRTLSEEHMAQEREFSDMRLQLERLVNLESLIVASNGAPAKAKHEQVGVSVPSSSRPAPLEPDPAVAPRDVPQPPAPPSAPADPAGTEPVPAGLPAVQQAPETSAQNSSEGASPPVAEPASLATEGSPLRISGFASRPSGAQRLRISYELSTAQAEDQRYVTGNVTYVAVLASGAKIELPVLDTEGTRFYISRMKPMQATARVPQEHKISDIKQIEVVISVAEGNTYRDTFPVTP